MFCNKFKTIVTRKVSGNRFQHMLFSKVSGADRLKYKLSKSRQARLAGFYKRHSRVGVTANQHAEIESRNCGSRGLSVVWQMLIRNPLAVAENQHLGSALHRFERRRHFVCIIVIIVFLRFYINKFILQYCIFIIKNITSHFSDLKYYLLLFSTGFATVN